MPAEHNEQLALPAAVSNAPARHRLQLPGSAIPTPVWYLPGRQSEQLSLLSILTPV